MANCPKNQHWVKRLYLRHFFTPETKEKNEPQIWMFSNQERDGDEASIVPPSQILRDVTASRYSSLLETRSAADRPERDRARRTVGNTVTQFGDDLCRPGRMGCPASVPLMSNCRRYPWVGIVASGPRGTL
jgi:hypothetical protein